MRILFKQKLLICWMLGASFLIGGMTRVTSAQIIGEDTTYKVIRVNPLQIYLGEVRVL